MDGEDIDETATTSAGATTTGDVAAFVKPFFYEPDEGGLEAGEFVRRHRDRRDRRDDAEPDHLGRPIILFPRF